MSRGLLILVSLLAAPLVWPSPIAYLAGAFGLIVAVLGAATLLNDAIEGRHL